MFNKINGSKWINSNNTTIYEDEFGTFHVTTESGEFEVASTFDGAVELSIVLESRQ